MLNGKMIITNQQGLHARPASLFTKKCASFNSKIRIIANGKSYDAKSILQILSAGISCGTEIELSCEGADEEIAFEQISEMLREGLPE